MRFLPSIRYLAAAPLALIAVWTSAACAQDTWGNYAVMTGQAAVLDHMNRENAKRLHKEKGLPPPDFDAAERRLTQSRESTKSRSGARMSASERARKCALVRANLHRLRPDQVAMFRRVCE